MSAPARHEMFYDKFSSIWQVFFVFLDWRYNHILFFATFFILI